MNKTRLLHWVAFVAGLISISLFTWWTSPFKSYNLIKAPESVKKDSTTFIIPGELRGIIDTYDLWVKAHIDSGKAPGAAVAIVKGGNIVHLKGYGLKSTSQSDSIDEHTVFRIASVSKGFASVLAGVLTEDSLLHWDDPVSKHLPDFSLRDTLNSKDLAIKHLLSHTTGLPRHAYTDLIESGSKYQNILTSIQQLPLIGPVGKYYSYQNVIYSLFSDIAMAATNMPYDRLMHQYLFKPIGMADASVCYDSLIKSQNFAFPHVRTYEGWRPTEISKTYYNVIPAAGVNASISDMANWLNTMMGNTPDIVSVSTLDKLFTPIIETPRRRYLRHWPALKKAYYGLGWRVFKYGDHKIIYHGGYVNDYRAEIGFDIIEQVGIVVLTNAPCPLANQGISTFFKSYFEQQAQASQTKKKTRL
ncbi:serine hydrolase domain-containing protein [Fulvivirgaceae bacterium BMA12]|uniref:Serine hydrolase domain-containing protein n=1 Tax=Agaribacillus aureus TaxID=3051825 RepID=A0ABT8LGK1_9BACT|nr:serine hydrolase domain-containing protein [Fulvivirgaceae bacterium BMA12]